MSCVLCCARAAKRSRENMVGLPGRERLRELGSDGAHHARRPSSGYCEHPASGLVADDDARSSVERRRTMSSREWERVPPGGYRRGHRTVFWPPLPAMRSAAGKFDHLESAAARWLSNAFGFFLHRVLDAAPAVGLSGCGMARPLRWRSKPTVRFPWSGGRHPALDCLVATPSALVGIESKRFEPFRGHRGRRLQLESVLATRLGRSHEGL